MEMYNTKLSKTATNLIAGLVLTFMLSSLIYINQDSLYSYESSTLYPQQIVHYGENQSESNKLLDISYFPDHDKNINLFSGNLENKLILLYFGSYAKWSWHNLDRNPLRCASGNICQLSTDHSQLRAASAVVVSLIYLPKNTSMWMPPNYKKPDEQHWIAFFHEAPWYLHQNHKIGVDKLHQLDGIFDWTASYRSDATFIKSYLGNCWYQKKKPSYLIESIDKNFLLNMKNKSALWVASHCSTTSRREDYVRQMSTFMNITIKGKCGTGVKDWTDDSFKDLDTYYFYLSFENSLCDEYITEKFFNILKSGTVPVVMGPPRQDYERLAPPNSFIHISDFDGPEDLTKYLFYLQNNPDEYMKYLVWKEEYHLQCEQEDGRQWGCHLCDKLYQQKDGQIKEGQQAESQRIEDQQTEGQQTEGQTTEGQHIKDFQAFWNKRKCYGHDYKFNTISIV